jgi:GNAT superfamily N-acetyltransferase
MENEIKITKTKILSENYFLQINHLWNNEFPIALNERFPLLLNGIENYNHYFIENSDHLIIAWSVVFEKDNEKRFSIIVDSKYKSKGLGTLLINKLKSEYDLLFGWVIDHNDDMKINGENYISPMPFYLKHDFEILINIRIENDMIKAVMIKWSSKKETVR